MNALRRPWTWSLLVSIAAAAVGVLWFAVPVTYPFGPGDLVTVSVSHLVTHRPAGTMLAAAGVLGVAVSVVAALPRRRRWAGRLAVAGAAVEAAFFAFVLSDASLVSTLGYLLAVAAPAGIVAAVVVACVRRSRAGYVAAVLLAVVCAVAVLTGALPALFTVARNVGAGLGTYGTRMAWTWAMAGTAVLWVCVAVATARRDGRLARAPAAGSAVSWGRVVTYVAAAGPLPYGLLRLSWLTPWPLDLRPPYDDIVTRVQGGLLGVAAVGGALLTLGLVSRWGEVFPRWVPLAGGRPVPVWLAVVPGTLVGGAVTFAAPSLVVKAFTSGDGETLLDLLLFPFPVWGPALLAAVFAYRLRRGRHLAHRPSG